MHWKPSSQEESAALGVLHDGNIDGARTPTRSLLSISSSNYMKRTAGLPEDIEVVEIELTSTRMLKLGRQKREGALFIQGPLTPSLVRTRGAVARQGPPCGRSRVVPKWLRQIKDDPTRP